MNSPFFTIIIPTYNRSNLVTRTVKSVLDQTFEDFELIVIDDCSTDDTKEVITNLGDKRIRYVYLNENSGVSNARNVGINLSVGSWIFTIDSDDELLEDSLLVAYNYAKDSAQNIGMIRFLNKLDNGDLTPIPPFLNSIWGFKEYIIWAESIMDSANTDSCKIIRRSCFNIIQYPLGRALEAEFHFRFAKEFLIKCIPEPLILVHLDADTRLSIPSKELLYQIANDTIISNIKIINDMGASLKTITPLLFNRKLSSTAFYCFIANRRYTGLKLIFRAIVHRPFILRNWFIFYGFFKPSTLVKYKLIRQARKSNS